MLFPCILLQGIEADETEPCDTLIFPDDVVPSSPRDLNEALQDEHINTLCNEAFDELLTQEFNPDGEDFSDDNKSEPENAELGKYPNSS